MAFGAGADGLGHHLHITGIGARTHFHLLDERTVGILWHVILHFTNAAEVLTVVTDEIIKGRLHTNPLFKTRGFVPRVFSFV